MKKIKCFIATAFSKENYFKTCVLILLAIIAACFVFSSCTLNEMKKQDFKYYKWTTSPFFK